MASEMRGFVFSLIFIIVFAGLLSSIPTGLSGTGSTIDTVVPIDPNLVAGFSDSKNYTDAAFIFGVYEYVLNYETWVAVTDGVSYGLAKKIFFFGFWLGHLDTCKFVSLDGVDRGTTLELTEITTDAEEGAVRYSLFFTSTGDDAGAFLAYWNITTYSTATAANAADKLYLLHGMGISGTATNNIGALLVGLLTLSLPEVPPLINLFLAVPIWACIVYVLWYVIKEMIPFV
jgi:hypothetical protein